MKDNKLKKQRGITLIALVITIIVMLILVAVTISMAVNGGLFEYASNAGTQTNAAIEKEQTLGSGKVNVDGKWYNNINDYIANKPLPSTYKEAEFKNGVLVEKATYTVEGEGTAVIPKGFKVLKTEGTTIQGGLVITDSNETDLNGENIGNQFVWIPVSKAIVTEAEIETIEKEKASEIEEIKENYSITNNSVAAVQSLVNSGIYPMAVQDGENYKGILYNFTHNSNNNTLTVTVKDWNSTSYREPAILEGNYYDYSTSSTLDFKYDSPNAFTKHGLGEYSDTLYQEAYKKMIKSVADNGGFYVGRYEISNDDNLAYIETKKDKTALVSTTWYEMYKLERAYAQNNSALGVTSEMIWGSQWDQMMLFVNGKDDGVSTAESPSKFYVAKNGNRNSGDVSTKTGMNTKDEVANIFDLEASRFEWTQEADSSDLRGFRGSYYSVSNEASDRHGSRPSTSHVRISSRAALYLQ